MRTRIRRTRIVGTETLAALAAAAMVAAPAAAAPAAARPQVAITQAPRISPAAPVVGQTVTAVDAAWSPAADYVRATYLWFRCTTADTFSCSQVAKGPSHVVEAADEGAYLMAALHVEWGRSEDWESSEVVGPVIASALPPGPQPGPPPPPASNPPPPDGTPALTPPAPTGTGGDVAEPPPWLSPFPVVRIKGWLTPTGARVTLFTVRAPGGTHVAVRCRGADCPRARYRRHVRHAGLIHLRPYERLLRGTMRFVISVTRRGYVGKRTVITLRPGKPPLRRDQCLHPGIARARSCRA